MTKPIDNPELTTKEAVDKLCLELSKDSSYYFSWQSNIAMQFVDELDRFGYKFPDSKMIANGAAKNFLNLLIKDCNKDD